MALALQVVIPYVATALAWIFVSDWVLLAFTRSPQALGWWSTPKGVGFVLVTAAALLLLLHRLLRANLAAHKAAEMSEARLRLALEAAQLGDWEFDVETGEVRRSPIHDQIYGYDKLQPVWTYKSFCDHVHPGDRQRVDELFRKAVTEGVGNYAEFRILRKDGALRRQWLRGSVVKDSDGEVTRLLGIVGDFTERTEAEEVLRLHDAALEYSLTPSTS